MKSRITELKFFYLSSLLVTAVCFSSSIAHAQTTQNSTQATPPFTGLKTDIPIGMVSDVELSINVALPEERGTAPRPVMVFIHGGGLIAGDKAKFNNQLENMAGKGIVAASLMYRFAPEHRFPAAIEDVHAAIRFLKANTEAYNLDPDRIVVFGVSSGGYLATMLGVTGNADGFSDNDLYPEQDSSVRAVIAQAGHIGDFSLPKYQDFATVDRFIDYTMEDRQTALKAMSPVTYLDAQDPPFFLSHGSADQRVPVEMTREFVEALKAIDHPHTYMEVDGGEHSLSESRPEEASKVFAASLKFFQKYALAE